MEHRWVVSGVRHRARARAIRYCRFSYQTVPGGRNRGLDPREASSRFVLQTLQRRQQEDWHWLFAGQVWERDLDLIRHKKGRTVFLVQFVNRRGDWSPEQESEIIGRAKAGQKWTGNVTSWTEENTVDDDIKQIEAKRTENNVDGVQVISGLNTPESAPNPFQSQHDSVHSEIARQLMMKWLISRLVTWTCLRWQQAAAACQRPSRLLVHSAESARNSVRSPHKNWAPHSKLYFPRKNWTPTLT